ncbi:hypothetical protein FHX81_6733 [Saccharothrix saharensis]|uniref:Uncharacterized protein n=1 Tax=Saccharothrix saharensis TaxID=571190 RepID=A0A543JN81_9PSEU|nr:hypothetical protein FHX81_6733 [Saccharothrix saharensis]
MLRHRFAGSAGGATAAGRHRGRAPATRGWAHAPVRRPRTIHGVVGRPRCSRQWRVPVPPRGARCRCGSCCPAAADPVRRAARAGRATGGRGRCRRPRHRPPARLPAGTRPVRRGGVGGDDRGRRRRVPARLLRRGRPGAGPRRRVRLRLGAQVRLPGGLIPSVRAIEDAVREHTATRVVDSASPAATTPRPAPPARAVPGPVGRNRLARLRRDVPAEVGVPPRLLRSGLPGGLSGCPPVRRGEVARGPRWAERLIRRHLRVLLRPRCVGSWSALACPVSGAPLRAPHQ